VAPLRRLLRQAEPGRAHRAPERGGGRSSGRGGPWARDRHGPAGRVAREVRARIEELDRRIAEALALHPDGEIFRSLPRAGVNRAALLLAEVGDCRSRYPDESSLAAAAGVAPSTRASGKRHTVSFRRGCDKQLRAALIDFAQDSVHASPWGDVYDRARARGCRHPHAVRILARAWVRVLWRCWMDGVAYDHSRHGGLSRIAA
jgi:transposase